MDLENYVGELEREQYINSANTEFDICRFCKKQMMSMQNEYVCDVCGLIKTIIGDVSDLASANTTATSKRKNSGSTENYRIMFDRIMKILNEQNAAAKKSEHIIPLDDQILKTTAQKYCDIYQTINTNSINTNSINTTSDNKIELDAKINALDKRGPIQQDKSINRRGKICNEIIAAILFNVCNNQNAGRKHKDSAAFMNLNRFNKGELYLSGLKNNGINCAINTSEDIIINTMACKYLSNLSLDVKYETYISNIISFANRNNIGLNSYSSSKVVGSIWFLLHKMGRSDSYTIPMIEQKCDNTRRNTFLLYYEKLRANENIFAKFDKYL
jgi:transcription initiation factor TFIIIB Brf1 subunit/transcription initiation factor TFIIB